VEDWLYEPEAMEATAGLLHEKIAELQSKVNPIRARAVEMEAREQLPEMVEKVYNKFGDIVKTLDTNSDCKISWEEFRKLLSMKEALAALDSVNVDPEGMIDVAEEYFFDEGEMVQLTFQEFMDMVLELRGGQQAMVKDVISLGNRFTRKFADLKGKLESMKGKMEELKGLRRKPAG